MSTLEKTENIYYISTDAGYADEEVLTLNSADTFGVFNKWGDIHPVGKKVQGLYHEGTRFISDFELKLNGTRPVLLCSAIKEENEVLYVNLTNPDILLDNQINLFKGLIYINRMKFVQDGISYEKILFSNFGQVAYDLNISFSLQCDFKDIFEIRGMQRMERGQFLKGEHLQDKIIFNYFGLDKVLRTTEICFTPIPSITKSNEAIFNIRLEPKKNFEIQYYTAFHSGDKTIKPTTYENAFQVLSEHLKRNNEKIATIVTFNEHFNRWIARSRADLISLLAPTSSGPYPYAGVPWYNTAFGRDGIITAYEILWAAPEIAKGVLYYLAKTQATKENASKDAEPGKIFHEVRSGEMAETGEIPFKQYYGTTDATPLFIVLAASYYKRTGDLETVKNIWPNILAALTWINEFGDIDGDGFVEYISHAEKGLVNQGWKDSYDSISHMDGTLADPPIALCEVQGYVYAAKEGAAMLAEALGHTDLSAILTGEAAVLKEKFNQLFWDETLKTYVLALDGEKKPCRIKSSNAGHALFTGIADDIHASEVAKVLLSEEMFSGWGIRTLASDTMRYNPMSYHNGSVWPHDSALIAWGLAKYGYKKEVLKIFEGLFDASQFMDAQRLPELFCGFRKKAGEAPVTYPVACSPQAWSVASLYMLLQASLDIEINAINRTITFHSPVLPEFIDMLQIRNLRLTESENISLILERKIKDVSVTLWRNDNNWKVVVVK